MLDQPTHLQEYQCFYSSSNWMSKVLWLRRRLSYYPRRDNICRFMTKICVNYYFFISRFLLADAFEFQIFITTSSQPSQPSDKNYQLCQLLSGIKSLKAVGVMAAAPLPPLYSSETLSTENLYPFRKTWLWFLAMWLFFSELAHNSVTRSNEPLRSARIPCGSLD